MTVGIQQLKNSWTITRLPITLPCAHFFYDTQVVVAAGTSRLLLDTDYTLSGAGNERGGTITILSGAVVSVGDIVTVMRRTKLDQLEDMIAFDPFEDQPFERICDLCVMRLQELSSDLKSAIRISDDDIVDEIPAIPPPDAPKLIGFDGNGDPELPEDPTTTANDPPRFDPTILEKFKTFDNVSYSFGSRISSVSNCEATLTFIAKLKYDPEGSEPTDDQKTLTISLVQDGSSSTQTADGFTILPEDWGGGNGLLTFTNDFPIYFLPSDEDEKLLKQWGPLDPYAGHSQYAGLESLIASLYLVRQEGYGVNTELRVTSVSFPGAQPGEYNGFGGFVYGTDTPFFGGNPAGGRDWTVLHRAAYQAGGTLGNWIYSPGVSAPTKIDFRGFGYLHTAPVQDTWTFFALADCGDIPPLQWGCFVTSPSFSSFTTDPELIEIAADNDNLGLTVQLNEG
jgi:hypothetical protein